MKRLLGKLEIYLDTDGEDSSVTQQTGARDYRITLNKGKDDYEIRTVGDLQTTLAHEMGHAIALMTHDPSHSSKSISYSRTADDGQTEVLSIPAEEKAWKLARKILPDTDMRKSEAYAMGTYHRTKDAMDRQRNSESYRIVIDSPPDAMESFFESWHRKLNNHTPAPTLPPTLPLPPPPTDIAPNWYWCGAFILVLALAVISVLGEIVVVGVEVLR